MHFENHFKARELPLPPEIEHPDEFPHLYQDEKFSINEGIPDEVEVDSVLKSFKNGISS